MTTLVDAILADIAARAIGRTRYEGQPPREDEALAGEIATLRAENARLREALELIERADGEHASASAAGHASPFASGTFGGIARAAIANATRSPTP